MAIGNFKSDELNFQIYNLWHAYNERNNDEENCFIRYDE